MGVGGKRSYLRSSCPTISCRLAGPASDLGRGKGVGKDGRVIIGGAGCKTKFSTYC
jgi:hypothetical protein